MNTQTDIPAVERKVQGLAAQVLAGFRESGTYDREIVAALGDLAASEDDTTAKAAARAVFTSLVEPLADSFDPRAALLYNHLFAQLIDRCRKSVAGRALDSALAGFGIFDERGLLARAERLRETTAFYNRADRREAIKRVFVLSRVTLGADVAVTSVILERLKREFPQSQIVMVGGRKAVELFGGDARLCFREIDYRRAGTLIERLLSWVDLAARMRELTGGLDRDEYLIVDPDSRLTQLGLLPLAGSYLFFPSREYGSDKSKSLGELTNLWLDEVFGRSVAIMPALNLTEADRSAAAALVRQLRQRRARPVVAVNFGVGDNTLKRAGDDFEKMLIASLLEEGASIILDKGAGEDEARRANAAIAHAARSNRGGRRVRVIEIDETSLMDLLAAGALDAELCVWSGRVGLLAALIAECDLYIGYDSAGQHIAAAAAVPCIDVFAGFSSPRMLERWRPTGSAPSEIVAVDKSGRGKDEGAVLTETLRLAREMLEKYSGVNGA